MKVKIDTRNWKIIVDIIQQYMDLPNDYGTDAQGNAIPCITIRSQNIKLFNTPKLQITVGTLSSKIYSNRKYMETVIIDDVETQRERIVLNEQRIMQIDVYSRNNEARQRFPEVQACLNSTYAQQMQDKYQFRIGTISDAVNLSGLDGGSEINRYTIRFNCLSWNEYLKAMPHYDYYNKFKFNAIDSKLKTIADFTIDENGVEHNV